MRCRQCDTPLLEKARFCSNCGLPVTEAQPGEASTDIDSSEPESGEQPSPSDPTARDDPAQTILMIRRSARASSKGRRAADSEQQKEQEQAEKAWDSLTTGPVHEPSWPAPQADSDNSSNNAQENRPIEAYDTLPAVTPLSPRTPSLSLSYFRLNLKNSAKVTHMPAVIQQQQFARRRSRGSGWGVGCLLTLVIVLAVLIAAWFLAVRPYLHGLAEKEINHALSSAINQIPQLPQVPPGVVIPERSIPLSETFLNNVITLDSSPSSPVQNAKVSISPQNFKLTFQTFGFDNTVTQVPEVKNGQLVATNVSISGPLLLIMTPDEMTGILNQNFATAQQRIQMPIHGVQLKDHEMDLIVQ
ncbi:MAG TPA: zinc ribbon domain-containing protein [Ktedonobacteraceae bacterium]